MKFSRWFALTRATVLTICGTLIVYCSHAPPEPAPEFTLPLSQVSTAPPSVAGSAETASAPSPAPVCRGAKRASGCRHGPRAHCCEEEGHALPPA